MAGYKTIPNDVMLLLAKAGTAANVYLALKSHDMKGDGVVWPAIETLMEETELSDRWVRKLLRKLEKLGLIKTEISPGRKTSRYHFLAIQPGTQRGTTVPGSIIQPGTQPGTVVPLNGELLGGFINKDERTEKKEIERKDFSLNESRTENATDTGSQPEPRTWTSRRYRELEAERLARLDHQGRGEVEQHAAAPTTTTECRPEAAKG